MCTFYRAGKRGKIGFFVEKSEQSPEMDRFSSALKSVMQVSKEELKEILTKEKAEKADKPKRGPKLARKISTS
jgi:hypothetical protein